MKIASACYYEYEEGGQSAVFEFVKTNYPNNPWNFCSPCDAQSPIEDNVCLVCGSEINR